MGYIGVVARVRFQFSSDNYWSRPVSLSTAVVACASPGQWQRRLASAPRPSSSSSSPLTSRTAGVVSSTCKQHLFPCLPAVPVACMLQESRGQQLVPALGSCLLSGWRGQQLMATYKSPSGSGWPLTLRTGSCSWVHTLLGQLRQQPEPTFLIMHYPRG